MRVSKAFAALTMLGLLATVSRAADETAFSLTAENSGVEFVGSKKDGSHTGSFKKLAGSATVKGADPATLSLSVVIDVNSMVTDNTKLTAHLKSPDFFDVKKHPEAKFVTKEVKKSIDGYTVTGELTMHGQTKPVSFPADISVKANELKLSAKFTIDRNDWGISYGKGMVDAKVSLSLSVTARK